MDKGRVIVMTIGTVLTSDCPAHVGLVMVIHITTPECIFPSSGIPGFITIIFAIIIIIITVKTPPRWAFDWWEYAG